MANGKVQWAQTFGGNSSGVLPASVAFTSGGKSIALGGGYSSLTFPIPTTPAVTLTTTPDVFVGDFDTTGTATNAFGAAASDGASQTSAVVVPGEMGTTYVAYNFTGNTQLGGATNLAANGTKESVAVIKLDANNHVLFDVALGGTGATILGGMALNPAGGIVLAGSFANKAAFGATTLTSKGGNDIFVTQLDTSLNVTQAVRYGDTGDDYAAAIAFDASGNMALAGRTTSGNLDLGCGNQPTMNATMGTTGVVGWFGPTSCKWVSFASGGLAPLNSVAVDPAGGVVAGGNFSGSVNFGGTMHTPASGDFATAVLWSLGSDGATRFANVYGTTGGAEIYSLAVDPWSDVVAGGFFAGTADLGGSTTYSANNSEGFVLKLDSSGKHLWDVHFGDAAGDQIMGVAVDPAGNIAAVGKVGDATSIVAASPAGGSTAAGTAGTTSGLLLELSP
jgi:hypothetical protein